MQLIKKSDVPGIRHIAFFYELNGIFARNQFFLRLP